jgi:sigma-B regulation protein RsbU (phosphoserine phosphatase)
MNPTESSAEIKISQPTGEVSAEVLTTLAEIGEEVNASLDLDEVLARTAALIKKHIDYEIFGVLLVEEAASALRHRFAIGYPRELADNLRIPLGQGITGIAAASGHPVRVSDVTKDSRYINAIDSVKSELAVPLMIQGKCIGVLDIQSNHLDYFTREQQSILTLLASRLAVAIENARLFERVRSHRDVAAAQRC